MSYGVVCKRGLDPALLWLWRRPAAVAPIRCRAWEPPYSADAALKRQKTEKKNNNIEYSNRWKYWMCVLNQTDMTLEETKFILTGVIKMGLGRS